MTAEKPFLHQSELYIKLKRIATVVIIIIIIIVCVRNIMVAWELIVHTKS